MPPSPKDIARIRLENDQEEQTLLHQSVFNIAKILTHETDAELLLVHAILNKRLGVVEAQIVKREEYLGIKRG